MPVPLQRVPQDLVPALWAACALSSGAQIAAASPTLPSSWQSLLQQPEATTSDKPSHGKKAAKAERTAAPTGAATATHVVLLPAQSAGLAVAHVQGALAWDNALDSRHPAASWALGQGKSH